MENGRVVNIFKKKKVKAPTKAKVESPHKRQSRNPPQKEAYINSDPMGGMGYRLQRVMNIEATSGKRMDNF